LADFLPVATEMIQIYNALGQFGNVLQLIQRDTYQVHLSRAVIELGANLFSLFGFFVFCFRFVSFR
jgi:hypothetical protein